MLLWLQTLPLPGLFAATLVISLLCCWATVAITRLFMRAIGWGGAGVLPLRDSIAGGVGGMFALIIVFSAAGIWNETLSARNAVHREADSLENAQALLAAVPEEARAPYLATIGAYARRVVETDWPAMQRGAGLDDAAYLPAESLLIDMIGELAKRPAALAGIADAVMREILETRRARLARIALADGGLSAAQWTAMLTVAFCAMAAFSISNNADRTMQLIAAHIFAVAAAAVFFLVLAHDRPFIGAIAVHPTPIAQLAK